MDDVELSTRKVWDYKRARHIERVSANEISLNQRLSKTDTKPSRSIDQTKIHKNFNPDTRNNNVGFSTNKNNNSQLNDSKTSELIQPENFEQFASSFNNLTYDQLQNFCLALSDQLSQAKKDSVAAEDKYDLQRQELESKFKHIEDVMIEEREKFVQKISDINTEKSELTKGIDKCRMDLENMKIDLSKTLIMAFDSYNVIQNISKNSSYIKPFGRFLAKTNLQIVQQYNKAKNLLSNVIIYNIDY